MPDGASRGKHARQESLDQNTAFGTEKKPEGFVATWKSASHAWRWRAVLCVFLSLLLMMMQPSGNALYRSWNASSGEMMGLAAAAGEGGEDEYVLADIEDAPMMKQDGEPERDPIDARGRTSGDYISKIPDSTITYFPQINEYTAPKLNQMYTGVDTDHRNMTVTIRNASGGTSTGTWDAYNIAYNTNSYAGTAVNPVDNAHGFGHVFWKASARELTEQELRTGVVETYSGSSKASESPWWVLGYTMDAWIVPSAVQLGDWEYRLNSANIVSGRTLYYPDHFLQTAGGADLAAMYPPSAGSLSTSFYDEKLSYDINSNLIEGSSDSLLALLAYPRLSAAPYRIVAQVKSTYDMVTPTYRDVFSMQENVGYADPVTISVPPDVLVDADFTNSTILASLMQNADWQVVNKDSGEGIGVSKKGILGTTTLGELVNPDESKLSSSADPANPSASNYDSAGDPITGVGYYTLVLRPYYAIHYDPGEHGSGGFIDYHEPYFVNSSIMGVPAGNIAFYPESVTADITSTGMRTTILDGGYIDADTGYSFTGWNTAADGSGTSYAPGDAIPAFNESFTLYAQYESTGTVHKVKYELDSDDTSIKLAEDGTNSIAGGKKFNTLTPPTPVR